LVREPFREYGRPPIEMEELERRYGPPVRAWEEEGRPFAEYTTSLGLLRFGLEEDRSGSSVHRLWRLRWLSQSTNLSHILEESVATCVSELLRPDVTVAVLDRETNYPRIFIEFTGLQIREVIWPRSGTTAGATNGQKTSEDDLKALLDCSGRLDPTGLKGNSAVDLKRLVDEVVDSVIRGFDPEEPGRL